MWKKGPNQAFLFYFIANTITMYFVNLCRCTSSKQDSLERRHTPNIAMGYRFASLPQCTVGSGSNTEQIKHRPLIGRISLGEWKDACVLRTHTSLWLRHQAARVAQQTQFSRATAIMTQINLPLSFVVWVINLTFYATRASVKLFSRNSKRNYELNSSFSADLKTLSICTV
jgi:hypothetical protein